MKKYALLLLLLSFTTISRADALDVEDPTKESDAALAENKSVQENLAKEKAEAAKAKSAASEVRKTEQTKKDEAIEEMKKSESEIETLSAEQQKAKADISRLQLESDQASKSLAESKLKLEKAKQELAALQQLRLETNKKFTETVAETDRVSLELKELESGKAVAAGEFQQTKENAKKAEEKLAAMKADLSKKKAQVAIAAADAKPQDAATASPAAAAVQAPATAAAAPPIQRSLSSEKPAAPPSEFVFKRDCKVYDRITRGPQVIGSMPNGSSITKTDESKYWIGFSVTPTQKGFVAKTCF